ncbi:hypothetical protein I302_105050 [Kwoniella bestiolae CBS 10118]|uniref:HTH APSES-type domain-containing protein n=1 Tax=Kwoniella bestiolae CBS 10118 TaxID=1296100 RepID=A0A1B9FR12_9TREE|nr:hypothetical protein I302_08876 [Kwoniella bestiolae CBS 10118]OCF21205.1 hypothetical protein I302_08876 [Kwoniella bestiolae CBS 10118]
MPSNINQQDDIATFTNSVPPPPPYSADAQAQYDLTPLPHHENRPRVPEEKRNPLLINLADDVKIVKFQTIVREGKEIVVGRIKVPTPGTSSHAFILRRYDTNAISLTTMYKVAFPGATDEDEKREMDWVKSSFDTRGTNGGRGSDVVRLAGQWVSRHLAIHLAPAYNLSDLIASLARAIPDPNVAYRKSQRSQAASEEMARQTHSETTPARPVPSMTAGTETASPAPKRQRREPSAPTADASTSISTEEAAAPEQGERHLTLEATTTVTAPAGTNVDMEAEIESAKQLVKDLKNELRLRAAVGEELEEQGVDVPEETRGTKRGKNEDEGVIISGGSGSKGKDRIVRKNKRVVQNGILGETGQKIAWGTIIFSLGVGAATLLPQYVSSFF